LPSSGRVYRTSISLPVGHWFISLLNWARSVDLR
jgi:hypothetical protein